MLQKKIYLRRSGLYLLKQEENQLDKCVEQLEVCTSPWSLKSRYCSRNEEEPIHQWFKWRPVDVLTATTTENLQ